MIISVEKIKIKTLLLQQTYLLIPLDLSLFRGPTAKPDLESR